MPTQKDLKRLVRNRMEKTGESYTTAHAHITRTLRSTTKTGTRTQANGHASAAEYAETAGMSNGAVKKATGSDWATWVQALDDANATEMSHKDIAKHVKENFDVTFWWAQSITVAYERIRGLRAKGQRRGGGYDVNKSKTVNVPIAKLYAAFGARGRKKWLGDTEVIIKTSTREKSMRLVWEDGCPVDVYFWDKGASKSQVQIQHRKIATKAKADKIREQWNERVTALAKSLAPPK